MTNRFSPVVLASALALSGYLSAGVILSNNLTESTLSEDTISTSHFEAISFATDNNTYSFNSAILLVAPGVLSSALAPAEGLVPFPAADIPEVDLYTDGGGSGPATLIQTLTPPGSFSGLAPYTFTGSGIILSPNTTYWVVLKTTSGNFSWAVPTDSVGSGVGFTDTWAFSSGSTWSVVTGQPDQAEVIGDLVAAPEPSSLWLIVCGGVLLLAFGGRLRRV